MCLHYLGKFEVSDWAVNAVIKCAFGTIWMINRIATKMTDSYCLSKQSLWYVSHHTIFISACAQNVRRQLARTQARRRWSLSLTALSVTVWLKSGPFADDASFQFVDVRDLGTIDSLLKHTTWGVVNCVEVRWVRPPEGGCDKNNSNAHLITVLMAQSDTSNFPR